MDILGSIFTPALVAGIVAWFIQKVAEIQLNAQLESHKNGLQVQLELHKAELAKEVKIAELNLDHRLNRLSFEHQTRFSSFHQKRREVIGDIYGLLADARHYIHFLVAVGWMGSGEDSKTHEQKAKESIEAFFDYFRKNRIYLDEETCQQLDSLLGIMSKAFAYFEIGQDTRPHDFREAKKTLDLLQKW